LHVAPDAQKILAYQANHNLLLSNNAEVYSKPELEIYADDVKCKHGATIGQLDQEALFYMRSRGIEYADAMNILLQGFAEDVLQNVTHSGIKLRVQELL
jgi:Fe-S cluster assembly protein SufD